MLFFYIVQILSKQLNQIKDTRVIFARKERVNSTLNLSVALKIKAIGRQNQLLNQKIKSIENQKIRKVVSITTKAIYTKTL